METDFSVYAYHTKRLLLWVATRIFPIFAADMAATMVRGSCRRFEPYIFEYVLRPRFWDLSFFVGAVFIVAIWQPQKPDSSTANPAPSTEKIASAGHPAESTLYEKDKTDLSNLAPLRTNTPGEAVLSADNEPRYTRWIGRYLAQRKSKGEFMVLKVALLMLYLLLFGAGLLWSYWLVTTLKRVSVQVLRAWWTVTRYGGYPIWVPIEGLSGLFALASIDLLALFVSGCLIVPLASCVKKVFLAQYEGGQAVRGARKEGEVGIV